MKKEKVIMDKNGSVTVDTSPEAFEEAGYPGFFSGQTVEDIDHDICKLEGIGMGRGQWANEKVLWCSIKGMLYFYKYNMVGLLIPKSHHKS